MYRRVNSGGFIGAMTLGIVIVMAVFTWVMWGMARQVFVLTDVMVELNGSFKSMVVDMGGMNENMEAMRGTMERMDSSIATLSVDIGQMNANMGDISTDMGEMTAMMGAMTHSMQAMTVSIGQMTADVGRASYAFSNPMSYMFGGGPFPF